MHEKFKNLPLRNGVGIVLLNKENKVFDQDEIEFQNIYRFEFDVAGVLEKKEIFCIY